MLRNVNVIGVGMTPFKTPKNADPYTIMGPQAGRLALLEVGRNLIFDTRSGRLFIKKTGGSLYEI